MEKEYKEYIKENADLIQTKKDTVIRILNAFIKAGTNMEKFVFPRMQHRSSYIPDFEENLKKEQTKNKIEPAQINATMNNLHAATTFDQVVNVESGGPL